MGETEGNLTPEEEGREPTVEEIVAVCVEILGDEAGGDFKGLDIEEALGLAYTLLTTEGYVPDEIFKKKGIEE